MRRFRGRTQRGLRVLDAQAGVAREAAGAFGVAKGRKPGDFAPAMPKKPHKAMLLGIGLDSDGHRRLTAGPNFLLAGGSAETHEAMTEKVVKIMEKLAAKGKTLESVSRQEFEDIAHDVGLKRIPPPDAN